jgi:Type I restriction modification DNA specificity domain
MSQSKKLAEMAQVKLGLGFKSAINDEGAKGTCYLIQPKDITLESHNTLSDLVRVIPESSPESHYLIPGDVVLRLRGPVFPAAVINQALELPIVATNQCAVIRCDNKVLSPYYLQWYLNSTLGQRHFSSFSEGTNINKVSAKIVGEMELTTPPLDAQLKIAAIHSNWLAQKDTYTRLIESGNQFFDQVCSQIQLGKF